MKDTKKYLMDQKTSQKRHFVFQIFTNKNKSTKV
jgi:hypothetical protein